MFVVSRLKVLIPAEILEDEPSLEKAGFVFQVTVPGFQFESILEAYNTGLLAVIIEWLYCFKLILAEVTIAPAGRLGLLNFIKEAPCPKDMS